VTQELFRGAAEQALAGAVHEAQPPIGIEGEQRDVDLLHHRAQQRRGLDGAEPLFVQGLGQGVDFGHHVAQRIALRRAPAADGEVVLAHRGDEVGQRLQRRHDVRPQGRHRAAGGDGEQQRHGPAHLGRVVARPEQQEGGHERRPGGEQGQAHGMLIEPEARHRWE
jgi:hypothetical protein